MANSISLKLQTYYTSYLTCQAATALSFAPRNWMIFSGFAIQPPSLSFIRTMTTIASLRRMSAKSLSEKILAEKDAANTSFAIIDVRDDGT